MINYKFSKNFLAYLREKAEKGQLVSVYVADIVRRQSKATYGKVVPMYVDNLNTWYNQDELLTLEEAQDAILISPYIPVDGKFVVQAKEAFLARRNGARNLDIT